MHNGEWRNEGREEMTESRVVIETFDSEVLKGNFLDDPSARRVAIYLPPGYGENPRARYPTVFFLVGFTGRGTMLLNESFFDENIQQRLDRLIGSGEIMPLIMVMPDCSTRYGGSQYINSLGTGRYEDHLIEELVPWVDENFRTISERYFRAVMGKSSGGYGSVVLAMRHSEVFGLMACHSGDMNFDLCYRPDFVDYLRGIKKYGGLEKYLANLWKIRPRDADFRAILNTVAMASCYSPNLDSPYGFDLPFDQDTGETDEKVWARWKEWDPLNLIAVHADALRYQRLVYLDAGTRDEFHLQYGARAFCRRLDRLGVPYQYEEFEDGHRDIMYRYDVSLKAISAVWKG